MFVGNKLPQYEQHFETRVAVRNKLSVLSSDQSPPFYDLLQFNNFRFLISVFGEWNFGRSYQVLVKSPKNMDQNKTTHKRKCCIRIFGWPEIVIISFNYTVCFSGGHRELVS